MRRRRRRRINFLIILKKNRESEIMYTEILTEIMIETKIELSIRTKGWRKRRSGERGREERGLIR
jgi:hypothetical protein